MTSVIASRWVRLITAGCLWAALSVFGTALASAVSEDAASEQARWDARVHLLESRLLAPCCWNQTLDVHDSEIARTLHREIADRVAHGETVEAIEDDIVLRYGERIRAVPSGSALPVVALATLLLVLAAGMCVFLVARRWRNAPHVEMATPQGAGGCAEDIAYDARIERELADL